MDKLNLPTRGELLKGAATTLPVGYPSGMAGKRNRQTMKPELPPPDPHESLGHEPEGSAAVPEPTAVYVYGHAAPEHDRVSDAILELRPGLLIVCDPS